MITFRGYILDFIAKFPEMSSGDAMETAKRFYEKLDWRLLNLCTCRDGDLLLTIEEYELWMKTHSLRHVGETRVVRDAVAASIQDAFRNFRTMEIVDTVYEHLGMPRPADSVWAKRPA